MASLYAAGWRQGSILYAQLPLDATVLGPDRRPTRRQDDHDCWVLVSQDCDLDQAEADAAEPNLELRPLYSADPPSDWGLRSWRLLLTDSAYIVSTSPRTMTSAEVLTELLAGGCARDEVSPVRRQALKTWLGLRYDRPAIPPQLVPLARAIAEEVQRRPRRATGRNVRDVLMQFDESADPVRFSLFAVIEQAAAEDDIREWLAEVATSIPTELGVADELEAATASRISLHLVETSYPADVIRLTWRPNQPEPDGAT